MPPLAGQAACPECGATLTPSIGCMPCQLRLGFESDQVADNQGDAPDQLAHYRIARRDDGSPWELGRGAMGITYRALDLSLDRTVAIKIVAPVHAGGSHAARERFLREARVAAQLRHSNIATVYQFGVDDKTGRFFYAMEMIEGETLDERVRRTGPLDVQTTLAIADQVVAALAVAEKNGLVHRDLKPANVMLVGGEDAANLPTVKVIDFGLAKALTASTDQASLTQGGFVGTPAFASPEQFGEASLDIRSDIYSLGLTLWFALTGKTPFKGRSVEEIRRAQGSNTLTTEQLKAARVPSSLRSLLKSMVAFEPAARPGTGDLTTQLRRCRSPAMRRIPFGAAAALVIIALAFFLFRFSQTALPLHRPKMPGNGTGTSNPQAHQAYLNGRSLWAKREYQTHKQAITWFEKAIALDPNYAEAYAGLADTYPFLASDDPLIARSEDYEKARAAANKAIELDATLADPHAALGLIVMNYEWDWPAAEKEFERALELNPSYPTAHHWYAEYLITQGRSDESLAEIKRAHELDPGSKMIMNDTGKILLYSRRYDEAIEALRKTLEMDSNFLQPHAWLAQVYYEKGLYDEAISEFKAAAVRDNVAGFDHNPWTPAMVGRTLMKAGRKEEAQKYFQELEQIRKRREVEPQFLVAMYLALGEKDQVFDLLEKEYEVRSTGLTSLKVNPYYDSLRSDPRFTDLMRRIRLAPPEASRSVAPEKSVLVLPFTNLSRNPDSAYLAEGLRDQIQTRLVKLADLRIISSGPAGASQEDTAELYRKASEAGATRILQGSVQAEGEVFRATIQLVEIKSGNNLWAETYDRKMSDLLQVEKEVAEDVASSLAVRLTEKEKQVMDVTTTSNVAAHEAYLKGRYFWNTRSVSGYEQARQFFNRAISLDPAYAQAYAGLADACLFLTSDNGKNESGVFEQAKAANRKALELDPGLMEAHASLGLMAMNHDWDWSTAEREFKRAIELNPNYATVRDWYSEYLMAVGRPEESLREMRKARELDPLSLVFKNDLGKMLFFARRYDEAIENLNQVMKSDPNDEGSHFWLGWAYAAQKKYDQALAEFARIEREESSGGSFGGLGYVYGMMGKRKEAEQMLAAVIHQTPEDPQPQCGIHISLGDEDKAFACLEEEFKRHATGLISLKTAPHYDSLRADPRFADLLRRVHLAP